MQLIMQPCGQSQSTEQARSTLGDDLNEGHVEFEQALLRVCLPVMAPVASTIPISMRLLLGVAMTVREGAAMP